MSHDFSINKVGEKKATYYFGISGNYYNAFYAQDFNNGMSGSNEGKTINKEQALKGVNTMLKTMGNKEDFEDDFIKFKEVILSSKDDDFFYVHFS